MTTELKLNLPAGVSHAVLARWLKQPGQRVSSGEDVLEIETEKVNEVVPAPVSGTLQETYFEVGDEVPAGEVVALIAEQ